MFTGLIAAQGLVRKAEDGHFAISCPWPPESLELGASIACDGCCLTVTGGELHGSNDGSVFTVDVSQETLSKTTLGGWRQGRLINLERPLKAGSEIGGHLVAGHVDGIARIAGIAEAGFSKIFTIDAPDHLAKFIAPKGSVALDGISLTVNEVDGARFTLNMIPHSLQVTTWGGKQPGDFANLEVDLIARYVARLTGK
jgi:riboflavin synthase